MAGNTGFESGRRTGYLRKSESSHLTRTDAAQYEKEKTDLGPLLWTGVVPGLYSIRDTVMKAPEDVVQVVFENRSSFRGEVDITVAFAHEGDLSDVATESIRCSLFALMSLLNIRLGDFLTPAAPIQVSKLGPENRALECLMS